MNKLEIIIVSLLLTNVFLLNKLWFTSRPFIQQIEQQPIVLSPNKRIDYRNEWIEEMSQVFQKYGTDKYHHGYHNLYGSFLGSRKHDRMNILEIGLGCGMSYGPGKSLLAWKEYFSNSTISIFEYNRDCAEKFRTQVAHLFIGDQSNFDDLKQVNSGGPYDVIIDDGGHSRKQMIHSLIGLFPLLKNGGVYVIEDLWFAYTKESNDYKKSMVDVIGELIRGFSVLGLNGNTPFDKIPELDISISDDLNYVANNVFSISCFRRACALVKKS
ncbi:unnamed protein product [Brachionus calyciflorus]|uniref:Uncharacterized protein n=1 Tax=Brachionus calyciflorus TaxID=104777 RepID=A0A813PJL7_9BILA|nr:unnamed protein product [Brachionus calyciflorus]